jgi:hypothetical protein
MEKRMRVRITITRNRDQSILEEDVAVVSDGAAIGAAIQRLLIQVQTVHPNTDLSNFTIKVEPDDPVYRAATSDSPSMQM